MSLLMAMRIAVAALRRNALRSTLTTVGITVGIAAVICTVALGEGSTKQIQQQLLEVGDYFVWIENGSRNVGGVRTGAGGTRGLSVADMVAVKESVPDVKACTAQVDSRVQIVFGNQNWNTTYRGVSPEYLSIRRWSLVSGSMFSDADVEARANVCVLGKVVVEQLFGDQDPIGQFVRVRHLPFQVIGVLRSKGSSTGGQDQDDQMLLPYTTAQRKIRGISWLDDFMCSVSSPETLPAAHDGIVALLRQRHRIPPDGPDDFNVRDPTEMLQLREETTRTMGLFLSAIACISLLVGGIGVMNIMLVSVAERVREIGLRMSVGARAVDVQRQFLAEALVLALAGGVVGVSLGVVSSRLLADGLGWPMIVSPTTVGIATCVASAIGIVFGYYPARQAAQLDPIEALRSE